MAYMHASPGLFDDYLQPGRYCLAQSGLYLPYVQPAESDAVIVDCLNPSGTNIVTCKDPRIQLFLDEVGGLDFDIALSGGIKLNDPYIPIFDYRTIDFALVSDAEVVGLTLRDILVNPLKPVAGHYAFNKIKFRDVSVIRRLCSQKKVILFLTGLDVLIETIWHQRVPCELFQQLNMMGFWAVSGFNFSVFGGECPVAQSLNQKKSLVSSMLVEENGMFTIPHIYAVNDFHIRKYQQWLKHNPQIQLVTMNCQMQRPEEDIEQVVRTVQAMLIVNSRLHIILQGYRFSEIHRLNGFLDRIHIAEAEPVKYAQNFQNSNREIPTLPGQYESGTYHSLVHSNIEYRSQKLHQLLNYMPTQTKGT